MSKVATVTPATTGLRQHRMKITPDDATQLLEKNDINRPLDRHRIESYARAMARGDWKLSPQGLIFSNDWTLLDGQHRLHAVIKSGKTVEFIVWHDAPTELFQVIDRGKARQTYLAMRQSRVDVAVARLVHQMLQGDRRSVAGEGEIAEILSWLGPALAKVNSVVAARAGVTRGSAPVRLAIAARVMRGEEEYVLPAYKAFTALDYPALPKIVGSLLRQIDAGRVSSSSNGMWDLMARTWIAFDPMRAELDNVLIKDLEGPLSELLLVLSNAAEQARASEKDAA